MSGTDLNRFDVVRKTLSAPESLKNKTTGGIPVGRDDLNRFDDIRQSLSPPEEEKPFIAPRGPIDETFSALGAGFAQTGEAIGGTMEMLGLPGGKKIREEWSAIGELPSLQRPTYLQQDDEIRGSDWRWWVRNLGENIPNFVMMYGVGGGVGTAAKVAGLGLKAISRASLAGGFGGSFTLEAGSQYSQAKTEMMEAGFDPDQIESVATMEGLVSGTANAIIEMLPMGNVFGRQPVAKRMLKRILQQGALEGGTEVAQEAVNVWSEKMGHKPDQQWSDQVNRMLTAGIVGGVMGGAVAGPMGSSVHKDQLTRYNSLADQIGVKDEVFARKEAGASDQEIADYLDTRINEFRTKLAETPPGADAITGGTEVKDIAQKQTLPEVDAKEMTGYLLYGDGKYTPEAGIIKQTTTRAKKGVLGMFGMKEKVGPDPGTETAPVEMKKPEAGSLPPGPTAGKDLALEEAQEKARARDNAFEKRKKAESLFDNIIGELTAEDQQRLEETRQRELLQKEQEEQQAVVEQEAQASAALDQAAAENVAAVKDVAGDHPQKQAIAMQVMGLSDRVLLSTVQKELGLNVQPAGQDRYEIVTAGGAQATTIPALRKLLSEKYVADYDADQVAQVEAEKKRQADFETARRREESTRSEREKKTADWALSNARETLRMRRVLSPQQHAALVAARDQLTPQEIAILDAEPTIAKSAPPPSLLALGVRGKPTPETREETQAPERTGEQPSTRTARVEAQGDLSGEIAPSLPEEQADENQIRTIVLDELAAQLKDTGPAGWVENEEGGQRIAAGGWISRVVKTMGRQATTPIRDENGKPVTLNLSKSYIANVIDKARTGKPLTEQQQAVFDEVLSEAKDVEAYAVKLASDEAEALAASFDPDEFTAEPEARPEAKQEAVPAPANLESKQPWEMTRAELATENAKLKGETSESLQAQIDSKVDALQKSGMDFMKASKHPEVAELYRKRDIIDNNQLMEAREEIKSRVKKSAPDADVDYILNDIYSLKTGGQGAVYMAAKYTQEAVKDVKKTGEKLVRHLTEEYGRKHNVDMDAVLNPNVSGWTPQGIESFKHGIVEKAKKISDAVSSYFEAAPITKETSPLSQGVAAAVGKAPAKPKPVATQAEEAAAKEKPLRVGDSQKIVNTDAVVADTKTIDGVRYELYNANSLKDQRGFIRVFDDESAEVVSIKEYPTYSAAEKAYQDAIKAETTPETEPGLAPGKEPGPKTGDVLTDDEFDALAGDVLDEMEKPAETKTAPEPPQKPATSQGVTAAVGKAPAKPEPVAAPAEKSGIEPAVLEAKQPWEMTRAVFDLERTRMVENGIKLPSEAAGVDYHKGLVEKALQEGKPVPAEVLKDYPDLQSAPAEAKAKQPWEMTREEVYKNISKSKTASDAIDFNGERVKIPGMNIGKDAFTVKEIADEFHKRSVKQALSEGRPVPAEVLKDYPDLQSAPAEAKAKQPWEVPRAEFGTVTTFPTGDRFNITGEAQRIRIAEEGQSQYFTSPQKAKEWIDKRHKREVQQALSEGKTVPEDVLQDYPDLAKKENEPGKVHKFSSTQLNLPDPDATAVRDFAAKIPDNEVYTDPDDPSYGREENPHVTVKYGLHTANSKSVADVTSKAKPLTATLGPISIFEADDYDVVKIDVTGEDLAKLNKELSDRLVHTDTHKGYKPHITIAYVKKGEGGKYVGDKTFEGKTIAFDEVMFSGKDGEEAFLPLQSAPNTEDAGAELTYNKRNRIKTGIKWADIADKNPALKVKETTKQNVYPRPDYQQMIDGGMQPLVAHLVKQVYDALPSRPATSTATHATTDAGLQKYIDAVNRVMDGTIEWANNNESVARWAEKQAGVAGAALGKPTSLMDMAQSGKGLLDTVYPGGWKNYQAEVHVLGGNKALRALQPGYDQGIRAAKALKENWPASQESWQKQGYKITESGKAITIQKVTETAPGGSVMTGEGVSEKYRLVVNNARWVDETFDTRAEAETAIKEYKPWLLLKGSGRIEGQFDTEAEATDAAREAVKKESKDQISDKGTSVEMAERVGEARRLEGEDITSDRLQAAFGFKGVNFGNWLKGKTNQAERQLHLNHAYDSFMDLAETLGVPPQAMSLNGMLGLAIGAQGTGAYAAHFVPGVNEINLTRTSGAGSLAHEFGHAVDHYFATQAGLAANTEPFLTEHAGHAGGRGLKLTGSVQKVKEIAGVRPEIASHFSTIVNAMNRKQASPEEIAARRQTSKDKAAKNVAGWLKAIAVDFRAPKNADTAGEEFDRLATRINALDLGEGMVSIGGSTYVSPVVAELRDLYKKQNGRVYSLENIKALQANIDHLVYLNSEKAAAQDHTPQGTTTDYAAAAAKLDKGKGGKKYWSTNVEKFARAFDAYVSDMLDERAAKNSYLSHAGRSGDTVPQGEERAAINKAFSALVQEIKTRETDKGVEMYSAARDDAPKMPTLADVQAIFKGQEVIQPGGVNAPIYVKTRGGQYLTVETVTEISPDEVNFEYAYAEKFDPETMTITGAYGDGVARLVRGIAGKWTLAHESIHFMEDSGILDSADIATLQGHIQGLVRDGKIETANKKDIGGSEDRANFLADALTKEKPVSGLVEKVVARVREFLDKLMDAFGIRTAGSVTRALESGRIFEREGQPDKGGARERPNVRRGIPGTRQYAVNRVNQPAAASQTPAEGIGKKAEAVLAARVIEPAGRQINRGLAMLGGRLAPETKDALGVLAKHWKEFWKPAATLPHGEKWIAERARGMGEVAKAMRFIEQLQRKLDGLSDDLKKTMFQVLDGQIPVETLPESFTTETKVKGQIVRDEINPQELARMIRRRSDIIGEMMVERGILDEAQFKKWEGKYIHYAYAYYVLGPDASIAVSNNGKLDLAETLRRNPDMTMEQRKTLGLIEDAAIAVPMGMGKSLTDIAKWDYLLKIAENPEWVWQPGIIKVPVGPPLAKAVRGRTRRVVKMTIGKLVDEVKKYKEMARVQPSPEVEEHYNILQAALDKAEAASQNRPSDFVELKGKHYGPLDGAFVRQTIYDDLAPVMGQLNASMGKAMRTFLEVEALAVSTFKMGKVALNFPTAFRNMISNVIQINLSGRPLAYIPGDIVKACEAMLAHKKVQEMSRNQPGVAIPDDLRILNQYYEEAFGMGIFHTSWAATEINAVLDEFRKAKGGRIDKIFIGVKRLAKLYGKIDDISKFTLFLQQRKEGATVDAAAVHALKWGMDYSLASRSVKAARRHLIPFGTYTYKIAPLIAESLAKRPWVLAKFALILPLALKSLAKSLHDLDDDDVEDMEKQLPAYIKKSGSVMLLPWKSDKGQWQWINAQYFLPWANMFEIFRDMAEMDIGELTRDIGITHPLLDLMTTFRAARDGTPPTHPFFGNPIYNQLDPAWLKVSKMVEHVAFTFLPSMLSPSKGALGTTWDAAFGKEDRWGREVTPGQAAGKWLGLNIIAVSPEQSAAMFGVKIQDMKKELGRIDADPSISEERKKDYHARLQEKIAEVAEQSPEAILPIRKQKGDDPVYNALIEMVKKGTLKTGPPGRSIEIAGTPFKMTLAQYREYLDKSSEIAHRKLRALVESPAWEQMTDKRQSEVVSGVMENARKGVRQRIKADMARANREKPAEKTAAGG